MELSNDQKLLIQLFKALEMEEEMIIPLIIMIQEKKKTDQVIDYILKTTDKGKKLEKDKLAREVMRIGSTK